MFLSYMDCLSVRAPSPTERTRAGIRAVVGYKMKLGYTVVAPISNTIYKKLASPLWSKFN